VDFRNTILILTSNLGSQHLMDPSPTSGGETPESALDGQREKVLATVRSVFRPEFLNRLDDIVVFSALSQDELAKVAELQIDSLRRRLEDRRLTLDVTPGALAWLAAEGNDPAYGARPLRRLIQTAIGDQLARELLAGEVRDGDTVRVDRADGAEGLAVSAARG
jgi:ATP-dependent Clp protease ATP-binding subunit ClpB